MAQSMNEDDRAISAQEFRYVLGNYPTGVTLITSSKGNELFGMVIGTFTSVSLSPPLVGFLPAKSSTTWPSIADTGRFCVNVLSSKQETVCRDFATKNPDRFTNSAWTQGRLGVPILLDAVAWVECTVENVLDAGDHWVVIGRVRDLGARRSGNPLLFFHGGYGDFRARSMLSFDVDVTRHIRMTALVRSHLEKAAQQYGCGCVILAQVGTEIVVVSSFGNMVVSSFGNMNEGGMPAWAGLRQPFMAPLGSQFAAHLEEETQREAWIKRLTVHSAFTNAAAIGAKLGVVRRRGYAIACDPHLYAQITELTVTRTEDEASVDELIAQVAEKMVACNDPTELVPDQDYDIWALHAPVFLEGEVAFSIGFYPGVDSLRAHEVQELGNALLSLARDIEDQLQPKSHKHGTAP